VRILFLAAEAAPFVKVGGLADVVGSLPAALARAGHDVRVAIPGYGAIDWARWAPRHATSVVVHRDGGDQTADIYSAQAGRVPFWLVTGPPIPTDRTIYASIEEDAPKFLFFSLASLWAASALGWQPDVVHTHDFHAAGATLWLGTEGRRNDFFRGVASVLTIHNLPYAGQGAGRALAEYRLPQPDSVLALPDAFRDSLLALGLLAADEITTVSPTYAREILTPEGGRGLDGILRARADRLTGIVNGLDVDVWNPATDPDIASRFDAGRLDARAANRAALLADAGLPETGAPVAAVVSRLDSQKGLDIALPAVRRWLSGGGQFVLLGTGDSALESEYARLELEFPGRASVRLRFDAPYAHRIYAGADALLIPSRYEPCGLTQLIAMRYGAIPVARRTGGLADTVTDAGEPGGTGVMFDEASPASLWQALERLMAVRANPDRWREIQRNGMTRDFSWNRSGAAYESVYARAVATRRR
jgi:starch synthase